MKQKVFVLCLLERYCLRIWVKDLLKDTSKEKRAYEKESRYEWAGRISAGCWRTSLWSGLDFG
ncbi:hypothetical protein JCM17380_24110 [Desulfosporosinus burensis]